MALLSLKFSSFVVKIAEEMHTIRGRVCLVNVSKWHGRFSVQETTEERYVVFEIIIIIIINV